MDKEPLLKAIESAGSARALAKRLGVTPMAVSQWKRRGVPANRAVSIERETGVSRKLLRPDIFGGLTKGGDGAQSAGGI